MKKAQEQEEIARMLVEKEESDHSEAPEAEDYNPENPEEPCERTAVSKPQDQADSSDDDKAVTPGDLREALLKEKRKKFAKKWFTKFNMYKRNFENLEISKRGRATSGIGDERIKQMETAYTIASKARGSRRGGFNRKQEAGQGMPYSTGKQWVDYSGQYRQE